MSYLGRRGASAALTTADIPDSSITTAKLIDSSVTSAKIGVDVIVAEDIANNAITVAEIADDAVTGAKLANDIAITTTGALTGTTGDLNWDSNTLVVDSSASAVGIGTATPDGGLTIAGGESSGGILNLWADEGDDNADKWRVYAGTSGGLYSESYSSGAWVNKFTVLNSGNVGIGIAAPSATLHVNSTAQTFIRVEGVNEYSCGIKIRNNYSSVQSDWNLGASGGTSGWGGTNGNFIIRDDTTNSTAIEFERGAGGSTGALYIDSSGNVGFGTSSPGSQIHFDSGTTQSSITMENDATYFKFGTYDFGTGDDRFFIFSAQAGADNLKLNSGGDLWVRGSYSNSDERLKTNIQTITSALSKVIQMRGVSFDWIADGKSSTGLIAQELELIAPDLVHTEVGNKTTGDTPPLENLKSVAYTNLVAYLIEAVKELSAKVTTLENA